MRAHGGGDDAEMECEHVQPGVCPLVGAAPLQRSAYYLVLPLLLPRVPLSSFPVLLPLPVLLHLPRLSPSPSPVLCIFSLRTLSSRCSIRRVESSGGEARREGTTVCGCVGSGGGGGSVYVAELAMGYPRRSFVGGYTGGPLHRCQGVVAVLGRGGRRSGEKIELGAAGARGWMMWRRTHCPLAPTPDVWGSLRRCGAWDGDQDEDEARARSRAKIEYRPDEKDSRLALPETQFRITILFQVRDGSTAGVAAGGFREDHPSCTPFAWSHAPQSQVASEPGARPPRKG
ncbi:hypothetical protein C8R45DRAFT_1217733 [Mycena sanguinolenta]|nr:hypothetical protein C8R45DRAFT_1217733 [Mycena sanguinolenta]